MRAPEIILANTVSPEVMADPPPAYVAKMEGSPPRKIWRLHAGDVLVSPVPVADYMVRYACEVLGLDERDVTVLVATGPQPFVADRIVDDPSLLEALQNLCRTRPGIGIEPFVLDRTVIRLADALGIPLARYRAFGGRPAQSALDAVHTFNLKSALRDWMQHAGFPVLPGVAVPAPAMLPQAARALGTQRVIVKKDRGSNGFLNRIFTLDERGTAELERYAAELELGPYIAEQAIEATSSPSAEFEVLDDGVRLVHICDMRIANLSWIGMTIPPFGLDAAVQDGFISCARALAEHLHELGYRGFFDIDGVYDGERWAVTESNLRTTGGSHMDILLRRLYGEAYLSTHRVIADMCPLPAHEPFEVILARMRADGLAVSRPGEPGIVVTADGAATDGKIRFLAVGETESETTRLEERFREMISAPGAKVLP